MTMISEPLRASFEAWYESAIWGNEDFKSSLGIAYTQGYQAALQHSCKETSQDAEDAERYRWLRDKSRVFKQDPDMSGNHYWMVGINGALRGATIDSAIDHARRIEGEGE